MIPGGGRRSFSGDTPVLLPGGKHKKIKDLHVGDEVIASDPQTGKQGTRKITAVWVHHDDLYTLTINGKTLTVTEDHPFWNDTDGRWEEADQLDPGDHLHTNDDSTALVTNFTFASHALANAYNLTVDDLHTYYVLAGNTPVLVHNTGPACLVAGGPRVRPGRDVFPDENGLIHAPSADDLAGLNVHGLSVFDTVDNLRASGLSGQVRAPRGALPDGLGMVADGAGVGGRMPLGHSTIYPTRSMTVDEFDGLIKGMDWQNIGVKLP
jgi:hypothetical protein